MVGGAVVVEEDDPNDPEGDGERADESPATILCSVHAVMLLLKGNERAERTSEIDAPSPASSRRPRTRPARNRARRIRL
jgi:hypothetical protein